MNEVDEKDLFDLALEWLVKQGRLIRVDDVPYLDKDGSGKSGSVYKLAVS